MVRMVFFSCPSLAARVVARHRYNLGRLARGLKVGLCVCVCVCVCVFRRACAVRECAVTACPVNASTGTTFLSMHA